MKTLQHKITYEFTRKPNIPVDGHIGTVEKNFKWVDLKIAI